MIFYNYYITENLDLETSVNTSNLSDILTKNLWKDKQTFSDDINLSKNLNVTNDLNIKNNFCIGKDCDKTLSKLTDDRIINNLCIGNTCITEDELKILLGKKSIYLYKPNDWNNYLYADNGLKYGNSDDSETTKKKFGSWVSTSI